MAEEKPFCLVNQRHGVVFASKWEGITATSVSAGRLRTISNRLFMNKNK